MPIDLSIAAIVGGATALSFDALREFTKKIAGKLGDDVGDLASAILTYKLRNIAETIRKAQDQVRDSGKEAHAIPPRTLIPLLEHASIEDDSYLQERWAALLAQAAVAESDDAVPALFVEILSQLSAEATVGLDVLAAETTPQRGSGSRLTEYGGMQPWLFVERMRHRVRGRWFELYPLPTRDAEAVALVDVLVRQGLATKSVVLMQQNLPESKEIGLSGVEFRVSELGRRFVSACKPPAVSKPESAPADDSKDR